MRRDTAGGTYDPGEVVYVYKLVDNDLTCSWWGGGEMFSLFIMGAFQNVIEKHWFKESWSSVCLSFMKLSVDLMTTFGCRINY